MTRPTLASAQTDSDVIAALIYATWYNDKRSGEVEVPALDELAEWWRQECPRRVRLQAEERYRKLMDWRAGKRSIDQLGLGFESEPSMPDLLEPGRPIEITREWRFAGVGNFQGGHPLAPAMREWLRRRIPIPRNTRDDPVFAAIGRSQRDEQAVDGGTALRSAHVCAPFLPTMGPGERNGPPNPTPFFPLELWDLSSGMLLANAQRGMQAAAHLAARIFVEVVLDMGPEFWALSASHGVKLPEESFGNFLTRFYRCRKSGRAIWRPDRQLDTMLRAFEMLEAPEMRFQWTDPRTGVGALRRVVVPLDIPRNGHLDDIVRFAIHLLPGVEEGPIVDRPILRLAGSRSAPAWRLWLNLAASFRILGRTRIPIGRGKWRQVRKPDRYRVVSDQELAAWAFPDHRVVLSRSAQRKRKERALAAVNWLERAEAIAIHGGPGQRRIMPGRHWAGWVENQNK